MKIQGFAKAVVDETLYFKENGERGEEGGDDHPVVFKIRVFLARDVDLFNEEGSTDPANFLQKAIVGVYGFEDIPDGEGFTVETAGLMPQWAAIHLMQKATQTVQVSGDDEGN